ncbi:MAG TPA: biopolymer transporter ExbD [Burkholderiales bacterium]|jgi:biopolymer transport protein ExbD
MAFGSFNKGGESAPMAEINMVPLIDVMLVLLVIFIVTAPLLTNAVKIDLPKATSQPNLTKPDNIQFAINAQGQLFWNGEQVSRSEAQKRFAEQGKHNPQPELHLHADKTTQYQVVAEVMADASNAGLSKIGFVSDPSQAAP